MDIVAGLSLSSLNPRVWDRNSPYYLPKLKAVMVSYADFHRMPVVRQRAMEKGLHKALGIPKRIKIYLDNGAFYFSKNDVEPNIENYEAFVSKAKPDWRPVPQDFIPSPDMRLREQRRCLDRTMQVNRNYQHDGFVPVIHVSRVTHEYIVAIKSNKRLSAKPAIALGGIVPHLLRSPKAGPHQEVLDSVWEVRQSFPKKHIHLFGVGGTATLHLAALLRMDSVDSSGWRNRAARGMIQLPGSGERIVAELGVWRGRKLDNKELKKLRQCLCPACQSEGLKGLKATGKSGFCNRATHNLWTLLEEEAWVKKQMKAGTYKENYKNQLYNSTYSSLINYVLENLL